MKLGEMTHVFYEPGKTHIIDCAWTPDGVNWQTAIYATPMAEVLQKHPSAQLMLWDDVIPLIQKAQIESFCSAPKEIAEERWIEMLEVLPPIKWRGGGGTESFMISEAICSNIRSIYCRIGDRYFELSDVSSLTHEEIVEKCRTVAVPA